MNEATKNETDDAVAGQVQRVVRRVVCAANKMKDGTIVCGARHYDDVMRGVFRKLDNSAGRTVTVAEQGFIDQRGRFMNRQEAWKVAEAAGQIARHVGGDTSNGGTLYSENLY
jgi:hypothetical protein